MQKRTRKRVFVFVLAALLVRALLHYWIETPKSAVFDASLNRHQGLDVDIFANETINSHNAIGYTKNFTGYFTLQLDAAFQASESTVVLHVFAWRRLVSLKRLLASLLQAKYLSKRVPLCIHLDGDASQKVASFIDNFEWPHGPLEITKSVVHLGLQASIMEAWIPKSDTEYGIFLEDDTEVSQLFYKYAVYCLLNYMNRPFIAGCSLYTPRINEISPTNDPQNPPRISFSNETSSSLFLLQVPCSWGSVMDPRHWKAFTAYYYESQDLPFERNIPNSRSNLWERSWKRFMIEYLYSNGLVIVYPNLLDEKSFSTNHYEEGVHSVPSDRRFSVPDSTRAQRDPGLVDTRFTVPLIQIYEAHIVWKSIASNRLEDLPIFDLFHRRRRLDTIGKISKVSPAVRLKILSLGDSGVGKSCLIKRYCENRFVKDYISTIGIDYGVKAVQIDGIDLKINFWDIAGEDCYKDVRIEFYKDTLGAILVYDTSRGATFDTLDKWIDELKKLAGTEPPIVLVGNKIDVGPRVVTKEEGQAYAEKKGLIYLETSANTGKNVKELFEALFRAVIQEKKKKVRASKSPEPK